MKHVAIRSCCGCRVRRPKKELIRFYAGPDGGLAGDPGGRADGRGAYLCPRPDCLQSAIKKGAFARTLRQKGLKVDGASLLRDLETLAVYSKVPSGEIGHGENLGH